MTEVAGEVADGFICHPFTTERYLREVTLPALRRGRDKAGKDLAGFEISGPSFVVTGGTDGGDGRRRSGERAGRSPSTARHRRTAPCSTCTAGATSRASSTACPRPATGLAMGELIDDDMLAAFAVVAEPEDVARGLAERYGDVVTRVSLAIPYRQRPRPLGQP